MYIDKPNLNSLILLFFLVMLATSSFMFINQNYFFLEGMTASGSRDGDITRFANDVRVKGSEGFFWTKLRSTHGVSFGDMVFTGSESSATIELKTGEQVELSAFTLLTLASSDGEPVFDLLSGSILNTGKKNILLRQKDNGLSKIIRLDQSEQRSQKILNDFQVAVQNFSLVGDSDALGVDEKIVQEELQDYKLLESFSDNDFKLGSSDEINIIDSVANKEIPKNTNKVKKVDKVDKVDKVEKKNINIIPQKKLIPIPKKIKIPVIKIKKNRTFEARNLLKPHFFDRLISRFIASAYASDNSVLYKTEVLLEWESVDAADFYEIEISKNRDMRSSSIYQQQDSTFRGMFELGLYYYRVRLSLGGEFSSYSVIEKFEVKVKKINIKSLVLNRNKILLRLDKTKLLRTAKVVLYRYLDPNDLAKDKSFVASDQVQKVYEKLLVKDDLEILIDSGGVYRLVLSYPGIDYGGHEQSIVVPDFLPIISSDISYRVSNNTYVGEDSASTIEKSYLNTSTLKYSLALNFSNQYLVQLFGVTSGYLAKGEAHYHDIAIGFGRNYKFNFLTDNVSFKIGGALRRGVYNTLEVNDASEGNYFINPFEDTGIALFLYTRSKKNSLNLEYSAGKVVTFDVCYKRNLFDFGDYVFDLELFSRNTRITFDDLNTNINDYGLGFGVQYSYY